MPGVVSLQLSRQVFLMAERPGCRLLGPGKRGGPGPGRAVGGIGLIGLQRIGPLEVIPPSPVSILDGVPLEGGKASGFST